MSEFSEKKKYDTKFREKEYTISYLSAAYSLPPFSTYITSFSLKIVFEGQFAYMCL